MRYLILCLAVLLCIAPVSAGLLDFLNGPTTGIDWDKTTIDNHLKTIPADDISTRQERTSQGIAAKVKKDLPISVSVTQKNPLAVNLSPLGDYYIRIDKAEYEPSTGMLKTYIYATRNGRELDIRNPVRWYGMGYTYAPDPGAANINTGKVDEKGNPIWKAYEYEDPKLALISSVYSFLQERDYGKIITDGIDPTVIMYPLADGRVTKDEPEGMGLTLYTQNESGTAEAAIPAALIIGHGTITGRFVNLYRASFIFNTSAIFKSNWTLSNVKLSFYVYNSSKPDDYYFVSGKTATAYVAFAHKVTYVHRSDFDAWLSQDLGSNAAPTNVTGMPSNITVSTSQFRWVHTPYFIIMLRHYIDTTETSTRFSFNKIQGYNIYSVTYAGTAYDPFLTIDYTVNDICPATTTCPSATTTPVCTSPAAEPGRMPVTLMYLMIPLALGLSLFSVWHYDNRVYANIVLGGMASAILWFFLAANVITGNIFLCSANTRCILSDVPLFWLFILFGIIMTVYTLALAVEAIRERNVKDLGGEEE